MTSYRVLFGSSFKRSVKKLQRRFPRVKDDLYVAIGLLTKRPRAGAVIRGSSGMRKLRLPNRDQASGKRGGYRLIYSVRDKPVPTICLLLLYSKSHKSDVTTLELRQLLDELIEQLSE